VRTEEDDIFNVLKKKLLTRTLYPAKLSFRNEGKTSYFQGKQNLRNSLPLDWPYKMLKFFIWEE
jgi:hypothetical protein